MVKGREYHFTMFEARESSTAGGLGTQFTFYLYMKEQQLNLSR